MLVQRAPNKEGDWASLQTPCALWVIEQEPEEVRPCGFMCVPRLRGNEDRCRTQSACVVCPLSSLSPLGFLCIDCTRRLARLTICIFCHPPLHVLYQCLSSSSSLVLLSFEVSCLLPCNLRLLPVYFIRLPCLMSGRMVLLATQLLACLAEFNY